MIRECNYCKSRFNSHHIKNTMCSADCRRKALADRNKRPDIRAYNSIIKKGKLLPWLDVPQTLIQRKKHSETKKRMIASGELVTPFHKGHTHTPVKNRVCIVCGKCFTRKRTKSCSDKCRRILAASSAQGIIPIAFKGFISSERKRDWASPKNSEWRTMVFGRDNFTCQLCGERGCYLEAHHIKKWSKYPALRYVLENGITLCKPCHLITMEHEEEYEERLQELVISFPTVAAAENYKKSQEHWLLKRILVIHK